MKNITAFLFLFIFLGITQVLLAQKTYIWHNQYRKIHYAPEGKSFVIKNGIRKFNRRFMVPISVLE